MGCGGWLGGAAGAVRGLCGVCAWGAGLRWAARGLRVGCAWVGGHEAGERRLAWQRGARLYSRYMRIQATLKESRGGYRWGVG